MRVIISSYQAKHLLDAYLLGKKQCTTSANLGLTSCTVTIEGDLFTFPGDFTISLSWLKKVRKDMKVCYALEKEKGDTQIFRVQSFSDVSSKFYKLLPTGEKTPPTLEISGIRMHVTKSMDPWMDTREKIKTISPIQGAVLDTCCGLGYSAIMAQQQGADSVLTCEIDDNCQLIASYNPWSSELFENDAITVKMGDVFENIQKMDDCSFDRVIHDPPSFSLAGLLYSHGFYEQLYRVMKRGALLYHYTGNPGSKKRGVNLPKNVMERLSKVGFTNVTPVHFGVSASKP